METACIEKTNRESSPIEFSKFHFTAQPWTLLNFSPRVSTFPNVPPTTNTSSLSSSLTNPIPNFNPSLPLPPRPLPCRPLWISSTLVLEVVLQLGTEKPLKRERKEKGMKAFQGLVRNYFFWSFVFLCPRLITFSVIPLIYSTIGFGCSWLSVVPRILPTPTHRVNLSGRAAPAPLASLQEFVELHSPSTYLIQNLAEMGITEMSEVGRGAGNVIMAVCICPFSICAITVNPGIT